MQTLNTLLVVLLIVGGINWGLVGLFQFDLVAGLFGGQASALSRVVYIIVGISALYYVVMWRSIQGHQPEPA